MRRLDGAIKALEAGDRYIVQKADDVIVQAKVVLRWRRRRRPVTAEVLSELFTSHKYFYPAARRYLGWRDE